MRVHRERLAGRDAEQRSVEAGDVVEEPALAYVGGARVRRIRVVQLLDVPAAVLGELRDRVPLLHQQAPQVVRRSDPSGEPACHADDDDRIVVHRGLVRAGDRCLLARDPGQLVPQERGQLGRTRVVVGRVDRHPVAQQGGEPLAQLHSRERVEAQLLERQIFRDIGSGRVSQHPGTFGQYDVQQFRQPRGLGRPRAVLLLLLAPGDQHGGTRGVDELRPVAATLEWVGGEGGAVVGRGEQRRPVRGGAGGVGVGESSGERRRGVAAERVQRVDGRSGRLCRLVDGGGEDGVGAGFDGGVVALVDQVGECLVEADGVAEVGEPVVGVQFCALDRVSGDGGDHGDGGCARLDVGQLGCDVGLVSVDLGGVAGVVDVDAPYPDALGCPLGGELVEGVGCGADDGGGGGVVGGDGDAVVDVVADPLGALADGGHDAVSGEVAHGGGADGDDAGGVVEAEDAGDVGGGYLTLGVTDDGRGLDAVGHPEAGEGDHDGEQGGLDHVDVVQPALVVSGQGGDERPAGERVESGRAGIQCVTEDRAGGVEVGAHARPLRALPRKHENRTMPGSRHGSRPGDHLRMRSPLGQGAQPVDRAVAVLRHHHRPMRQQGTRSDQRVGHVGEVKLGVGFQTLGEPRPVGGQRRRTATRHHQRHRPGRLSGRGVGRRGGGFAEDEVGVGASDAER